MSDKVKVIKHNEKIVQYYFYCPGCREIHGFGRSWEFNGDLERPTVQPSLLRMDDKRETLCHSFIRDGRIRFLEDSKHELAGKEVDLPDFPGGVNFE